ncbi:MAG: L-fucose:H+ symporter permease [Saprospiraceae bacterium]|nr:L-fucose:H+ symporter permease [Saprospiraceae bacterium]
MSTANNKSKLLDQTPILAFVLVTSLFLMWGLANNMTDTLLAAFKKIMSKSDAETSWIQFVFYGSYFLLAIPAAIITKKYSYKSGILIGLGLFVAGALLFYPASKTMVYGHFLAALFILAGGLSILETAANPYIVAMGPEETGTQRLNLAQSFNPIGSILGVELSRRFILSKLNQASADERAQLSAEQLQEIQAAELSAVMGPYVGVALVLLLIWLAIAVTRMPKAADSGSLDFGGTFKRLLKKPNWVWGVIAQFFYVGAQICVWSYTIRYVMQELSLDEANASQYYSYALYAFLISRFVCTFLMRYIDAKNLLGMLAAAAIGLTAIVMFGSGYLAVYALVSISACMSLMFPTIYALGVAGLGEDTKIGGSGLIMAILGGAILTQVMGFVSDASGSIKIAYLVPLLCFGVITYYGFVASKRVGA